MNVTAHLVVGHITQQLYDGKNLDFECNLTGITEDLSRRQWDGRAAARTGKIQNLSALADRSMRCISLLLPILTLQKLQQNGAMGSVIGLPSLDSITFASIRGDYTIQSGVMNVQTFDLTGQQMTIQTTGTVGPVGVQPLNMKVVTQLSPGNGGLSLKFNVTGTVPNPHVKLDVQDAGKQALQQIGGQLLKNFMGGANRRRPPMPRRPTIAPSSGRARAEQSR